MDFPDLSTLPAYIDAGTGSLLLQLLIGGLLGSLFIIKTFWRRLVGLAGRVLGRKPPASSQEADQDEGMGK